MIQGDPKSYWPLEARTPKMYSIVLIVSISRGYAEVYGKTIQNLKLTLEEKRPKQKEWFLYDKCRVYKACKVATCFYLTV